MVFGPAGWFWRYGSPLIAAVSIGVLAAVFFAESIYIYMYLPDDVKLAAVLYAIAGLVVPVLLGRTNRQRLTAYAPVIPALVLAAGGYVALIGLSAAVTTL